MFEVFLLATLFLTELPIAPSTEFLQEMEAKWVPYRASTLRDRFGEIPTYRVLLTRSQLCTDQQQFSQAECAEFWNQIPPSLAIRDGEVEATRGDGTPVRHTKESYCALSFKTKHNNKPYDAQMCQKLWSERFEYPYLMNMKGLLP